MRKDLVKSGAILVVSFTIYALTLCPTIYWEDSAAFCAVHSLLGIPHSPGFPLYVILGRVATLLPVLDSALCSNLMSAFWGSAALAVLFLVILEIYSQLKSDRTFSRLSAGVAVLFLAFSSSFWLQTVRAEVYSLNLFFTVLLVFLLLEWKDSKGTGRETRFLLLFSFVLGVSMTNHPLLAVTVAPALLLYFLATDFRYLLDPRRLSLLAIFFLLGASLYLYLPIRSNLMPAINWGKPDSWPNLLAYLFRTSQEGGISDASSVPYLNRFWFNLSFPVAQFGLPFFWLGVVGAISLFKSSRRIMLFTFVLFILNLLTATWAADFSLRNYDLLGYLLPSLCMFTIWFAWGVKVTLGWIFREVRAAQANPGKDTRSVVSYGVAYAASLLILLLPAYQMAKNMKQCNKHSQVWAHTYASQILSSVKKNALILTGDDNTLTCLWYLNLACGRRPDVKVASISALRDGAYQEQISRQYPDIALPGSPSADLGELAYQISRLNARRFPVYSTYFSSHPLLAEHLRPAGYLFELSAERTVLTDEDIDRQKDFLERNLDYERLDIVAREHFGNLIFNLGAFYDRRAGSPLSVEYLLWALDIDPSNSRIYFQLGKAFLKRGDKVKASEFFQAGLELEPYNQEAKRLLEQT